jgi:REP element-mobilizing transposase RayT
MGRKPRIEYEGAIYHIIQRGNNKEYIFKRDEDKRCLIKLVEEYKEMMGYKVYGFVIMDNHYHFIIQIID